MRFSLPITQPKFKKNVIFNIAKRLHILIIKSAKINCFLRFSFATTQLEFKKNVIFYIAKKVY